MLGAVLFEQGTKMVMIVFHLIFTFSLFPMIMCSSVSPYPSSANVNYKPFYCSKYNQVLNEGLSNFGPNFTNIGNRSYRLTKGYTPLDCNLNSKVMHRFCFVLISKLNNRANLYNLSNECWINSGVSFCNKTECELEMVAKNDSWYCCCKEQMCNLKFTFTNRIFEQHSSPNDVNSKTVAEIERLDKASLANRGFPFQSDTAYVLMMTLVPLTFIALFIILSFLIYRLCRKGHDCNNDSSSTDDSLTSKVAPLLPPPSPTISLDRINRLKEIKLLNELAVRHFGGCVKKALLGNEVVAVKIFNAEDKQSLEKEVNVYTMDAMKIGHENVLKFIGAMKKDIINEQGNKVLQYWLVTEYQDLGSLYDFLKNNTLTFDEAYKIILTACRGLFFLHQPGTKSDLVYRTNNNNNITTTPSIVNNNCNNMYNNNVFNDSNSAYNSNNNSCNNSSNNNNDDGVGYINSTANANYINFISSLESKKTFNINIPANKFSIAHRDIKSRNILLKSNLTSSIADFGLALVMDDRNNTAISQVGTRRYMSPEVLDCTISFDKASFLKVDMYAFALVVWEVLTRTITDEIKSVDDYKLPYEDRVGLNPSIEDMQQVVVEDKLRPNIRKEWLQHEEIKAIVNAVEDTWDSDPDARLTATSFLGRIDMIMSERSMLLSSAANRSADNQAKVDCNRVNNATTTNVSNAWKGCFSSENENSFRQSFEGHFGDFKLPTEMKVKVGHDLISENKGVQKNVNMFHNPISAWHGASSSNDVNKRADGSVGPCNITINSLSELVDIKNGPNCTNSLLIRDNRDISNFGDVSSRPPTNVVVDVGGCGPPKTDMAGGTLNSKLISPWNLQGPSEKVLVQSFKGGKNVSSVVTGGDFKVDGKKCDGGVGGVRKSFDVASGNNSNDDSAKNINEDDDDEDDDDNKNDNYERLIKSSFLTSSNNNNNSNDINASNNISTNQSAPDPTTAADSSTTTSTNDSTVKGLTEELTTNSPNFLTMDKEGDYLIPPLNLVKMATPFIPSPDQSTSSQNNFFNFPTTTAGSTNNNDGSSTNNSNDINSTGNSSDANSNIFNVISQEQLNELMMKYDQVAAAVAAASPSLLSSAQKPQQPPTSMLMSSSSDVNSNVANVNTDQQQQLQQNIIMLLMDKAKQQQQYEQQQQQLNVEKQQQ
uniref:receptor protein serine/threonine kinase n=1 Tax=Helobdella sp. Austin TaxID=1071216 RepID=G1EH66_9ANNE|nr:activin type II receptor S/T kinase [Helobdella sp. Austin]